MNNETVILAIETSSRIGSIALGFGNKTAREVAFSGIMRHSAEIFPAICRLLDDYNIKPENIEHLYISNGPGSFTGLRIAATLAKTLYLANNLKIVTVDTLNVIASNLLDFIKETEHGTDIGRIASILDAKRGQFFIAVYDIVRDQDGIFYERILPDSLMTCSEFLDKYSNEQKPIWLLGDGLVYHKKEFMVEGVKLCDEKYWSPHASKVHEIGWKMAQENKYADPVELKPFYLCRPDIRVKQR